MSTSPVSASDALARAAEAFRDTAWESFEGYSPDKVRARSTVVSYEGGRLVFEVERHRSVLGGSYSPGRRMSAFETYQPRFAYEVETGELEELESEGESEVEVNAFGLAFEWAQEYVFNFRRDEEGRCIAEEMMTGDEAEVKSEEVRTFARDVMSVDGIEFYLKEASELQGQELREVAERIYEHLSAELVEKAVYEWRTRACDDT